MLKKAERLLFSADLDARPALATKILAQLAVQIRIAKWNATFMRKYGTMKSHDAINMLTELCNECDLIQMEELRPAATLFKLYLCTPRVDSELLSKLNSFMSDNDRAFIGIRDDLELNAPFLTARDTSRP